MKIKKTINIIYALLASVALAWFAFSSTARALNPPPDGGYPGFNTQKGRKPSLASPLASGTQQLDGIRSLAMQRAVRHCYRRGNAPFQHRGQQYGRWWCGAFIQHRGLQQYGRWRRSAFEQQHRRFNTSTGTFALASNTTGFANIAVGSSPSIATPPASKTRPSAMTHFLQCHRPK